MRLVVGITGASGIIYGKRLLEVLKQRNIVSCVIMTNPAQEILRRELSLEPDDIYRLAGEHYDIDDLTSSIASGSQRFDAMTIVPCSMASASAIANGLSKNLILRVADICLKEGRPLVIVPRETPISTIHLTNLLRLSRAGVSILPASPAFYHKPQNIQDLVDFIVGRILLRLGLDQDLFKPWKNHLS